MSRVLARGVCPGLSAPMETGDGLLARLLPNGPMPLDAFIGLCEAARVHGNGIIEVSARGSLQIRGLTPLLGAAFCRCGRRARNRHRRKRAGHRRSAA